MKLYNTLSRKIEEIPKKEHLNLYTCGPTVYNLAHIGNLRSYIMADLLYRALKYEGYNPRWVMNITDIDDKTIKGAVAEFGNNATVADLKKYTNKYFEAFKIDLQEVNVLLNKITFIKVTDVIPEIQKYILTLIDKGYAYKADDGSTYFSIEKYQQDFGDYGGLVGEKFLEGKKVGARVAVDEYEKENLSDFALWKAWDEKTDAQIFWDHPLLGKGRPGWHIECSVINKIGFKGEPTDIHTGGVDLIFPHHTNEIAQSQALVGKGNFVKHWFHSEHLLVDGKKMAKSLGNIYTLKNLKDKYRKFSDKIGLLLRDLFTQTPYNTKQDFTFQVFEEMLGDSENLQEKMNQKIPQIVEVKDFIIVDELKNDLNVAEARASIWGSLKKVGQPLTIVEVRGITGTATSMLGVDLRNSSDINPVLNLDDLPKDIQDLYRNREQTRKDGDFAKSDELRKQIEELGYGVMDTPQGQKIKRKIRI